MIKSLSNKLPSRCFSTIFTAHLKDNDPDVRRIIMKEVDRQKKSINLIASENFTQNSVLECLGTYYSVSKPDVRLKDL